MDSIVVDMKGIQAWRTAWSIRLFVFIFIWMNSSLENKRFRRNSLSFHWIDRVSWICFAILSMTYRISHWESSVDHYSRDFHEYPSRYWWIRCMCWTCQWEEYRDWQWFHSLVQFVWCILLIEIDWALLVDCEEDSFESYRSFVVFQV